MNNDINEYSCHKEWNVSDRAEMLPGDSQHHGKSTRTAGYQDFDTGTLDGQAYDEGGGLVASAPKAKEENKCKCELYGAMCDNCRKQHIVAQCTGFITRDSGKRSEFETGAVRDLAEGKGRYDLIPALPIKRLAQLYERGAIKYGDRNWQKGIPLYRFLDSAERHLYDYKSGDRVEDHLTAVIWNVMGYIHTEAEIKAGRLPASLALGEARAEGAA